jgi:putative DNA primase/helicase
MFDLAARVSKDGIMPDGSQGATANAEDDLHDTIKPRLLAAGANIERLFHISEVGPAGARRPLRIPADVPLIGRFIKECSARLLIVDPLTAFLAGVDINREQDIRKVLMLLSSRRETTRDVHPGPTPQRSWREDRFSSTKSRKLQEKVLAK